MSGFASELEATNQKTETRCNGIRKEVSKALSEQRQQLIAQSEAMAKKMDGVAAKVHCLNIPSVRMTVCLVQTMFRWLQSEAMAKKMDGVAAKVHCLNIPSVCKVVCLLRSCSGGTVRSICFQTGLTVSKIHTFAAKLFCLLSCLSSCLLQCVAGCACLFLR